MHNLRPLISVFQPFQSILNRLQNVQIRLNSNGFDLTQASIVWVYNGATVASGIGKTMITVVAPANGRVGTISATANGSDFSATTATLILRPASVDVLWEGADSYTPPFYKGSGTTGKQRPDSRRGHTNNQRTSRFDLYLARK